MSLPLRGAWIETPLGIITSSHVSSLPLRGAWIETPSPCKTRQITTRRSPCGERGLKPGGKKPLAIPGTSLPLRGAWIETPCSRMLRRPSSGRSPCGERGLKHYLQSTLPRRPSRSPCGERGLKRRTSSGTAPGRGRSPCGERGLKPMPSPTHPAPPQSLPLRGAWIETIQIRRRIDRLASLPLRGAWIETCFQND